MSKKKSYMNENQILNEGPIKSFLKALFTGKSKKKVSKNVDNIKSDLNNSISKCNNSANRLEKALKKEYGVTVKLKRQKIEDFI